MDKGDWKAIKAGAVLAVLLVLFIRMAGLSEALTKATGIPL